MTEPKYPAGSFGRVFEDTPTQLEVLTRRVEVIEAALAHTARLLPHVVLGSDDRVVLSIPNTWTEEQWDGLHKAIESTTMRDRVICVMAELNPRVEPAGTDD